MNDSRASNSSRPAGAFSVAGWSVDASSHHISKDGKTTRLEPRTMELLLYLASRPGETISREELEREVWPGQVVVYEALSNSIAKLRKALGDDPKHHHIIETIPKVGYRLIGEVSGPATKTPTPASEATLSKGPRVPVRWPLWAGMVVLIGVLIGATLLWSEFWQSQDERAISNSAPGASASKPSIAVLPFTNMSGDPEQEYFADGMTDDLITDLSKISGLLVIARNSTFKYKGTAADVSQVAQEFGVRYVLEGSVRQSGGRLRINAQLIDTSTGAHVWAERFDNPINDIFAVQDKVTRSVVNALAVHLTTADEKAKRQAGTDNAEAYQSFLRGKAHFALRGWEHFAEAITNFEKALELDPNYFRVYGALAEVYWLIWSDGYSTELGMSEEESWSKMEHYLAEAMKNPTAQAQLVRSRYLTNQGRFEEAVAAAEQIIRLNPNGRAGYRALGRAANKAGRAAQGLDASRTGRRVDPLGSYAYRVGESLFLLGKYEEAAAEFLAYQTRSGDEYWSYMMLAGIYAQLGRNQEAKVAFDKFKEARARKGKSPHTLADFDEWSFVPSVRKRYVESLRMAGMPPGD